MISAFVITSSLAACQQSEETSVDAATLEPTFTNVNTYVFQAYCVGCHSGSSPPQSIDLSSYTAAINSVNASGGFAILPGDPGSSRVWIRTRSSGGMPPSLGSLPSGLNELLRQWIENGAEP